MRHRTNCTCLTCQIKRRRFSDISRYKAISQLFKSLILKSLKFKVQSRGRFNYRKLIERTWAGEEFITVNEYTFQLIKCRYCDKIAKAYLNRRLKCINCCNNSNTEYSSNGVWDVWGGKSA